MKTEVMGVTQVISGAQSAGTQVMAGAPTGGSAGFTGGLLSVGEEISGWRIVSKIAVASGEADLYVAEKNSERGCIKYYRGKIHPKSELLDRLVGLNHSDIINLFEYGTYKNRFYEIMEYAAGGSLDTRGDDGSYKFLPLSETAVEEICREMINAFKTCHEMGIIHRDIKPANLYYRDAEHTDIVIGDFGISSVYDKAENAVHKTHTASRTTGYAAPEVLSGIISPKMDYYAMGITVWELLTGKDPFVMDNGKRRNDAHLIRDTIEGRMADDILSKEPFVSEKMQRLIKGLLVIDDKKRWGYDEVLRHLNGENVEIAAAQTKTWSYSIGDVNCTTLEELGIAIADNQSIVQKDVYRGFLSAFLEDKHPDVAKQLDVIVDEASASGNTSAGIAKIVWLLNPSYPLVMPNGFSATNIDDIIMLLKKAPETVLPYLSNENSNLYIYLEHLGYRDKIPEIKKIMQHTSKSRLDTMLKIGQVIVILQDNTIRPFKLEAYKDFEISETAQLEKIPKDLRSHIVNLVTEKSLEGYFVPWLYLNVKHGTDIDKITNWETLRNAIA